MLEVRGLSAGYGRVGVLREISLSVPAGKIVARARRQRRRKDDADAGDHRARLDSCRRP